MNRNEQDQYLDRTLPQGFEQMMQAINEMSREQRRALVNEALRDMNEEIARGTPRREDLPMQRIIDEGMRSYLSDASAEAKLDLQPLIQRMQAVLQEAH